MDHGSRRRSADRFEQVSRNLLRWVLGPGLLSLHIGVYLITVVALLLWNFARTPNDVWVDKPLRSWGLVVVFHITAVAVGWSAWRLMRLGETPPATPRRTPRTGVASPSRQYGGETMAFPVNHSPVFQATVNDPSRVAAHVEDGARHWLRDSVRLVREVVSDAPSNGTETSSAASTVAGPGITEWGSLFVRRTREMMASARDHVSPAQHARQEKLNGSLNGVPIPPPSDPTRTWPESPPESPRTPETTHPTPVNRTWPTPNTSMADRMSLNRSNGTSYVFADHTPIDPVIPTAEPGKVVDPAANEDARWTWVESAAAAWMSRRERDDPPTDLPETPLPSADDASTTP